jgi:membrane-associated phospholipid phosphatase
VAGAALAREQAPQPAAPAASAALEQPAPEQEPAERTEPRYGKRLWVDLKALVARPAHLDGRDWRNLGIAALAVGGTMVFDEEIRDFVQGYRSEEGDDAAETLRPLGNRTGPALLLGGLWVAGALADEPSLVAIGKDGVEASLFSVVLITPVMKKLVGRARPDEELGPTHFEPFSEFQSFPSGEATQAFTIAAVIAAHTENPWVEGVSWGLAGLIGLERLYLDRHWASDVVAGALIGAGVGSWVARRQMRAESAPGGVAWVVVPAVGRGSYGVFGSVSF